MESIRDRIIHWLGGGTRAEFDEELKKREAVEASLRCEMRVVREETDETVLFHTVSMTFIEQMLAEIDGPNSLARSIANRVAGRLSEHWIDEIYELVMLRLRALLYFGSEPRLLFREPMSDEVKKKMDDLLQGADRQVNNKAIRHAAAAVEKEPDKL